MANEDRNKLGWDDLVEDAFGVNLRGLKTMRAALMYPSNLFEAAREQDWNDGAYSSSLRVLTFLIALLMFSQFIWASPSSVLGELTADVFKGLAEIYPSINPEEAIPLALKRYIFVYPIIYLASAALFSLVTFIWGSGTQTIVRIRLFFAALIPSMIATLIIVPLAAFLPTKYGALTALIGIPIFLIDFFVIWKGLKPVHSSTGQVWRGLLFAYINANLQFFATFFSIIVMALWLMQSMAA